MSTQSTYETLGPYTTHVLPTGATFSRLRDDGLEVWETYSLRLLVEVTGPYNDNDGGRTVLAVQDKPRRHL